MTVTAPDRLTARDHAGILARAGAVHARTILYRLAIRDNTEITQAADDLLDATSDYHALEDGHIHPASVEDWEDLAADGQHEAYAIGLDRAAEAVREWTDELIRLFPACEVTAEGES